MMHTISERFIHAMSGIERWLATEFPLPRLNRPDFGRRLSEALQAGRVTAEESRILEDLWRLRAILVHESYQGRPPAAASLPGLVQAEQLLEKLTGRVPRLSDLGIASAKSVTTTRPTTSLSDALMVMVERDFSAIPVVDESNRFIALMTDDDIVHWLAGHLDEHGAVIIEDTLVAEVMHAAGPDYTFVPRDLPQRDARRIFQRHTDASGAPLMAMLITMKGNESEPLLGILTPWDLPRLSPAVPDPTATVETVDK